MRKPFAFFVAGFATVAGGGLAVAVEGSPASSTADVPDGPPFSDMEWVGDLPPGPPAHAAAEGDDTEETAPEDVVVEVQAPEQPAEETGPPEDAGPPADTHGAAVSEAAHTCPPGPEHGACVSEVARTNGGGGGDDTEVEEPEVEAPEVEDDAEAPPADDARGRSDEAPGRTGDHPGHGRGGPADD